MDFINRAQKGQELLHRITDVISSSAFQPISKNE